MIVLDRRAEELGTKNHELSGQQDLLEIRSLDASDHLKAIELLETLSECPYVFWSAKDLKAEFEVSNGEVLGLWNSEEKRLLSFIVYRKLPAIFEISFLATARSEQGGGKMQKLLNYLVLNAARNEVKVWLEAHQRNAPAIGLYQKLGFKKVGLRSGYYRDQGDSVLFER